MPDKLHKTNGIVLRTVKYGETSVVVTIFTGLFGLQSYLVNGVRTAGKKGSGKAGLFQPGAILELVVYHSEQKQLHRIREYRWGYIYQRIFSDVPCHAVALYITELLGKCLKQPESNPDLFDFTDDILQQLDQSGGTIMANLPLFYALHLPVHFGFRIDDNFSSTHPYLDLQEGHFVPEMPAHPYFLEERESAIVSQFLKVMQPAELNDIKLGHDLRRHLLQRLEYFYALHIQDFGTMKTLPVLREVLG